MNRKLFLASATAVLLAGAAMLSSGGCSLGLDPNLIPGSDAGSDAARDTGLDAPNPTQCKADPDCKSPNGCLTGKCVDGQCAYTLCPASACNVAVCGQGSCSAPTAYGFHAGSFHVALGNIGCGGIARRCFAAVYPFVFVGTTNGVVAYSVADPVDSAPKPLPVAGLPFFPNLLVASGTTIYFVGPYAGAGPDYKIPIATLSVPTDPTVKEMNATTVFDTLEVAGVDAVFPDTSGGVYLVKYDSTNFYPAAHVTAPLTDLASLTFEPTAGLPAGSAVAAASGSRLVAFRQQNGNSYDALFSLESAAATVNAQNGGEQSTLAKMGQTYAPTYVAQSPSGGVLWNTASVDVPDGGFGTTVSTRLAWVLADQVATAFDATVHVDVATYNTGGLGGDLPGPVAWVDDNTAIVTSASTSNQATSVVQIATRNGTPTIVPGRSFQLSVHPSQLGVAASSGFGYVLSPDQPDGARVDVFGTSCN